MRKALLAATVAIATMTTAVSAADLTIGLDGVLSIRNETETSTPSVGDEVEVLDNGSGMFLAPRVSIRASDLLEISPYIGFGFVKTEETDKWNGLVNSDGKPAVETEKTMMFGAGVGAYFHVIDADWFGLSTGPRLNWRKYGEPTVESDEVDFKAPEYETHKDMSIGLDVPLNLDFTVNDKFGFRVSASILDFTVSRELTQAKVEGDVKADEVKTVNTDVDFLGLDNEISVGIFFNL